MPTTTPNYGWYLPLVNDPTDEDLWGGYLNDNTGSIDTLMRAGITFATQASQTSGFSADASISVKKLYPCNATGGGFSATIPSAATAGNGAIVAIKKTDSGANIVTLARSGSDTLDGATSLTITRENGCYVLVSDGVSKWLSISKPPPDSTSSPVVQTFTSSGTYTPTSGIVWCFVQLWPGGGGGGGVTAGAPTAAGGGGTGYAQRVLTAAQIGASQVVTIGAGGTAGANSGGDGGTGGTSSLGSLLSCTGGLGGKGNTSLVTSVLGGGPGTPTNSNLSAGGSRGGNSMTDDLTTQSWSGQGGDAYLLGGGAASRIGAAGDGVAGATNTGGGGSGALSGGSAQTGGVGGSGFMIITEHFG